MHDWRHAQGAPQTRETYSRDCRGLDQFDCGKINAIPLDIPRRELPTDQLRVRADEKIRQRQAGSLGRARTPTGEPVAPVSAATDGCGRNRKIKDDDASLAHVLFDFVAAPRASVQFSQCDTVNRCGAAAA
jgi:hypothetical protein